MMSLVPKPLMLMAIIQAVVLATAKPIEQTAARMSDSQPVYEQQLTVWPTDIDDFVDALQQPASDISYVTMVEEPIAVMPDMDYEQDDEFYDEDNLDEDDETWPTTDNESTNPADDIQVVENYHKTFANGTEEHKLVLSNGLVNFQRIGYKLVKDKLRPVHDGYYTVPSDGTPASYQTIYYHADENGYNVYKTEQSARNPAYNVKEHEATFE